MKTAAMIVVLLAFGALALAGPDPAPVAKPPPLECMKALAGVWHTAGVEGKPGATVRYRVTAGGSAVMETLFEGSEKEMITMYHVDGDHLMLTHYCVLNNQPRMKATPSADGKTLTFSWLDGTNMKSRDDMHMDGLTLTFTDDTHVRHDWTMWESGKVVRTVTLELTKESK